MFTIYLLMRFSWVHDLAERDSCRRAGDGREERRSCDSRRADTAVLAAVGDHVDGNELE